MKESMLDVLIYLLEEYADNNDQEREYLTDELVTAGFGSNEIGRAWGWLDDLAGQVEGSDQILAYDKRTATRVLSQYEKHRLSLPAQHFLAELQASDLIDTVTFEVILDRLVALECDADELDMEQLKWVVLMVTFNRASQINQFVALDQLIFADPETDIH